MTKEREAQIRKLHKKGLSFMQIAAELGVSRGTVAGCVTRLGLSKSHARVSSLWLMAVRRVATDAPPPVPAAQPTPLPIGFVAPVALLDLEPHRCRWPVRDVPSYLFCGRQKTDGSSYCNHHRVVSKRRVGA
jgi:hypothetical protein